MVSHNPPRLDFRTLLQGLVRRQISGCLQINSTSTAWSIYLDHGKLTYATNSLMPFERLDRHLYRLSRSVPLLSNGVRTQVRALYARSPFQAYGTVNPDYLAILWLVGQQYLTNAQAKQIIQQIAQEVLLAVLKLPDGQYNIVEKQHFEQFPVLCRIDIEPLLEKPQDSAPQTTERFQAPDFFRVDPLPQEETRLPNALSVATLKPLEAPKPVDSSPREILKVPPQGFRIACIDDSPTILQTIQAYLDEQFTVVMISDPLKALIQIMRSKPNIILLDVGMPNLDGYELCALLRRHPHFKETPVIMVTGHTGLIDRARAKLVGASGYLTKPFTKPDLIKAVLKHLPPQD